MTPVQWILLSAYSMVFIAGISRCRRPTLFPATTAGLHGVLFYLTLLAETHVQLGIDHHLWSPILRLHTMITLLGYIKMWIWGKRP